MNLYLLKQDENNGYDTYDSCVVAAETECDALHTHPSGSYKWDDEIGWHTITNNGNVYKEGVYPSWELPNKVMIRLIGTAHPSLTAGVVCASFNAG